jgi:LPS sulfotransferase NodH
VQPDDFFGTQFDPVHGPCLIIAMTARTGSSQLCSILGQLGVFGIPLECLNPRGPLQWILTEYQIEEPSSYLTSLSKRCQHFCFKVAGGDWTPFADRASRLFPNARYVYLERHDHRAQAESLARALLSGVWHHERGRPIPVLPPIRARDFAQKVRLASEQLAGERALWQHFFEASGITPLKISYESLTRDPASAVRSICHFAGVDLPDGPIPEGRYRKLPTIGM